MKPLVMQLVVALRPGGAERLALNILHHGRDSFTGLVGGMFQPPGELTATAEALGIPWVALRGEECGRANAILRLYKILRSHRVALLHVQAAYLLQYALPAAKLAGIPLVYTEHALHSLQTMPRLRLLVRLCAPFLQGIICVSAPVADWFVGTLGIASKRLRIICNGVDTQTFSPEGRSASIPWPSSPGMLPGMPLFVFGTVSRLCEAKDHGTLLRAFASVYKKYPWARLLVVGDGEERTRIEELRAGLGLTDLVHMTGMRGNVPEWLRSMDAFVLSSKREGLPMALLEAMACGLPVVSTHVGGIAAINDGEERLILVPPENATALAQAMERLVENDILRQTLAERGRKHVLMVHGGAAMAAEYHKIYRQGGLR